MKKQASHPRLSASRSKIRTLLAELQSPNYQEPLNGLLSQYHGQPSKDPQETNSGQSHFLNKWKNNKTTTPFMKALPLSFQHCFPL